MLGDDRTITGQRQPRLQPAALVAAAPAPRIAEPKCRQQVQRRRLRAVVRGGDRDQDIVRPGFGILDQHVEAAALAQYAGIGQLELRFVPAAPGIFRNQLLVGEAGVRIAVHGPHPGMRRRGIEVVVALLHVLAVVALGVGQPEEPFFQERIAAVPEGQGEAQAALAIGDAQQAVFAPAIGPAAGLIVGEVAPAVAVRRVVFADRGPLPFGQVRAPAFPICLALGIFGQALGFAGEKVGGGHGQRLARCGSCWTLQQL